MSQCLISQDLQSRKKMALATCICLSCGSRESWNSQLKLTTVRLARGGSATPLSPSLPSLQGPAHLGTQATGTASPPWTTEHYRNVGIVIKWGRSLRFKPGPPELNEYWSQEEEQESNHRRSAPSCGGAGRPRGSGHSTGCWAAPSPLWEGAWGWRGPLNQNKAPLHLPSTDPSSGLQNSYCSRLILWSFLERTWKIYAQETHEEKGQALSTARVDARHFTAAQRQGAALWVARADSRRPSRA